ncbi:aconitate hydratase [Lysinibacillus sp. NPDC093216]|uniref:aconitate hydratase n=1 Tax=Lysinibacillus sp. NPDC093216 TaxID=3390576 RepID=UPI003D011437
MPMIKHEDRGAVYEYIKLDMAIRSLQHDYASLEKLKMSKVYMNIVDGLLKSLRNDFYNKKRMLAKKNIEIIKWVNVSEYFSDVIIKTGGEDEVLNFAKQALKTHTEELIRRYLKEKI